MHAWRSDSKDKSPLIQEYRSLSGSPTRASSCASEPCRHGFIPPHLVSRSAKDAARRPSQKSTCDGLAEKMICANFSILLRNAENESVSPRQPHLPSRSPPA